MGVWAMSPVGSMTVSHAVFVRLVSVSNGRSVIANVFVMASCSVVLGVRRHPNAWSPHLSNVVPHVHVPGLWMMGSRSLRCVSSVKDSLFNRFEGSLLGELCSAVLANGLSELGRKGLVSFGISGICVRSSAVVMVW